MTLASWLPVVVVVPLLLAPLCVIPATRAIAFALAPVAALPALALAVLGEASVELQLPALLVGLALRLDPVAQVFLLFTAIIGLLAGWAMRAELGSDPRRFRFAAFYLAGLGGNLGVILAHDVVSFYTFFALMAFSAYGLVIHRQNAAARYAGRVYIAFVVLGEGMLLAGLILVAGAGGLSLADAPAAVASSPYRAWIVALLLGGFGVKAGLVPLHLSLPLAYAAAPVAGAVLLAGAMLHAGLLGWLRLLPLGLAALPAWGGTLAIAGAAAMFYGVAVGLAQVNAKALLAYSSASQMGFMTVALGVGLLSPPLWPLALAAVLVYATHHALVKSALFLSVGAAAEPMGRRWVIAASLLPAVILAGAPFTSGAVAKFYLKDVVHAAPAPWATLESLLSLGALATALLMARFVYLLWRAPPEPAAGSGGLLRFVWLAALGVSALLVWFLPHVEADVLLDHWRKPYALWHELWPVLGAVLASAVVLRLGRGRVRRKPWIPPGDILVLFAAGRRYAAPVWQALVHARRRASATVEAGARRRRSPSAPTVVARGHRRLQAWPVVGMLFLLVMGIVLLLLAPYR